MKTYPLTCFIKKAKKVSVMWNSENPESVAYPAMQTSNFSARRLRLMSA